MPLQARASALKGPDRVEFTIEKFIKQLEDHGVDVTWSKALFCPNRDPKEEDHHVINCSLCANTGYVYYDPITTRMLATSFGLQQIFMPESRYTPGTVYLTSLPAHRMSFWDKIEITNSKARFTEVEKLVPGTTKYQMKYPIIAILAVLTSAGVILPTNNYEVTSDKQLNLLTTLTDDFIAVSYTYAPTYIVQDLIHVIRDTRGTTWDATVEDTKDEQRDFPCQVSARLDFLVRDESL